METVIVAIPTKYTDARKVCESVENDKFESIYKLRDLIIRKLDGTKYEKKNYPISIYRLTNFMDECNNVDFKLDDYFISYSHIENIK